MTSRCHGAKILCSKHIRTIARDDLAFISLSSNVLLHSKGPTKRPGITHCCLFLRHCGLRDDRPCRS